MKKLLFRRFTNTNDLPREISSCYQEYSDGLNEISLNNLAEAERKFKRCIDSLKINNSIGNIGHNYILQRLALVQRGLKMHRECENSLETIVENCENNQLKEFIPSALNLIKQCMNTNLPKAREYSETLSKAQLNEYLSEFQFLYGVIKI